MAEPYRLRSSRYMAYIRTQPCLICGDRSQAHHITYAQPRAMSSKTSDAYCVPLCAKHHHELHNSPLGERSWWATEAILPVVWAENKFKEWSKENGDDYI